MPTLALAALWMATAGQTAPPVADRPRPFVVKVVDDETLRGIPLVELRTVNNVRFFTDSAGVAAIDDPGFFGREVYFTVLSFGYTYRADQFGNVGTAFKIEPGGEATLAIRRTNLAERLYRVTGEGIYRDSVVAGRAVPIREPLLNANVFGSDSVLQAVYRDKLYWFWGDTNRPGYPLGNFHVPGATSLLPGKGGLDPEVGVDLTYFVDETGFAKPTARMPGRGPTWLSGLVVLRDASGRERMFALYEKIREDLGALVFEVYERGLVEFDDEAKVFRKVAPFPQDAPAYPGGHPFLHQVGGVEYVYFTSPLPLLRVRADPASLADLTKYEAFTPLAAGTRLRQSKIERDASGRVVYGWKRGTEPVRPADVAKLVASKALNRDETPWAVRDETTDRRVEPHSGSVWYNPWRKRWAMIFVEAGGASYLGEVWYAEADSPLGPWAYARQVATHSRNGQKYSFYNPKQHPAFDKDKGRTIFFEGTYSITFSGNSDATPRYDYNQLLYKLDLARPELSLPVPVYELSDEGPAGRLAAGGGDHPGRRGKPIPFFALDRGTPRTMPIREYVNDRGSRELRPGDGAGEPVFHVLPFGSPSLPGGSIGLLEFLHDDGLRHAYAVDPQWSAPGFRRTGRVLGYVWRNPIKVPLTRE